MRTILKIIMINSKLKVSHHHLLLLQKKNR